MLLPIARFVDCYVLPPGRAIHALERVYADAKALGLTKVAARAEAAIAEYRRGKGLQLRLRTSRPGLYGPDTTEIDAWLDRGLTSLDGYLDGQLALFPADHARVVAASAIKEALFPQGVQAITRQSFVQQRVDVDELLVAFESPDLATARAALPDLTPMMADVAELNRRYGASIDAYERARPTRESLREVLELAHTMLLETVVTILAEHMESAPALRERVAMLREPIERQNQAVRATRRRRQQPIDIDPDTGIELPDDEPPVELPGGDAPPELPA